MRTAVYVAGGEGENSCIGSYPNCPLPQFYIETVYDHNVKLLLIVSICLTSSMNLFHPILLKYKR